MYHASLSAVHASTIKVKLLDLNYCPKLDAVDVSFFNIFIRLKILNSKD